MERILAVATAFTITPTTAIATTLTIATANTTFTSIPDMAKKMVPFAPALIVRYKLDSLSSIKKYNGLLLHCHGDADTVIPFAQGIELFKACPSERKKFVRMEGRDHNDPLPESYREQQQRFFDAM